MSLQVSIRAAEASDAPALTRLARRAKASWGYPEAWLREWEPQLELSAEYLEASAVYVALAGEEVVGLIALEDQGEPEIAHMWVSPDHQGRGVGRQLVKFGIEVARSRGWNSLRVESDPNAQTFYEGLGAVQVDEVAAPVGGTKRVLPVLRLSI